MDGYRWLLATEEVFILFLESLLLGCYELFGFLVLMVHNYLLKSKSKIAVSIGIVNRKLAVMLCVYGIKIGVRDCSMRDRRSLRDRYELINES